MSNLQMWSLLVGFLAPPVISIVQQPKWPGWLRTTVTTVLCIFFGGVTAWQAGDIHDTSDLIGTILVVLLAAMTFYKRFWTPTSIAPRIEAATSPSAVVKQVVTTETAAVEPGSPLRRDSGHVTAETVLVAVVVVVLLLLLLGGIRHY